MKKRPFKKNRKKAKFLVRKRFDTFTVVDIATVTIDIKNMEETWEDIWPKIDLALIEQHITSYCYGSHTLEPLNSRAETFKNIKHKELVKERKLERRAKQSKASKRKRMIRADHRRNHE